MGSKKVVKVAITGAAGQIAYALLFRLASGAVFGPNVKVKLHLIELEEALPRLEGVVMELEDCAFPLLEGVVCTSSLNEGFKGVNWALLVGSVPRQVGMERSDLLAVNAPAFCAQGRGLAEEAASDVQVLVVGNPCNTNAWVAMKHADGIPKERFFAMTLLDQYRAQSMLAAKAGVPVDAVSQVAIWGNHSASLFADYFHGRIQGKSLCEVIDDNTWLDGKFMTQVQQRGAAVIAARGASSAASAANAALETVAHLAGTHPTSGESIFSVASCLASEVYGFEEDLIVSAPHKWDEDEGVGVVAGWEHQAQAQKRLKKTLDELVQEREAARSVFDTL